ncbi:hypothetical protein KCN56_08750 [Photobacterium galatheae]|uniref:hypothetical protein n=1 Tax=Photobacterium galatheae TaxID=1654360 RepID=UPI00202CC9C8|nr:hypothetical protein [Photobacterium galatheae]MCM0148649.1 hypothetical protein [Photobacterium galatheae]
MFLRFPWAKAYYNMLIERGKPHNTAIRALAFKWGRILSRCWQDSKPYDEAKYINTLVEKKSPIIAHLAAKQ